MYETTTTDMSKFGYRERKLADELLTASIDQGFPDDFEFDGVTIMFNMDSGNVFFTNSDYQVCMMNGDKLESFYSLPYSGEEGFKEDFEGREIGEFNEYDAEFLIDIGVFEEEE